MAESCCFSPNGMVAALGLREIVCRTGATTVIVSDVLTLFEVAVMVAAPSDCAVAMPVLLTEIIPAGTVDHETDAERSCVLPSVNVPVALSCTEWLGVSDGL